MGRILKVTTSDREVRSVYKPTALGDITTLFGAPQVITEENASVVMAENDAAKEVAAATNAAAAAAGTPVEPTKMGLKAYAIKYWYVIVIAGVAVVAYVGYKKGWFANIKLV